MMARGQTRHYLRTKLGFTYDFDYNEDFGESGWHRWLELQFEKEKRRRHWLNEKGQWKVKT